MSRRLSADDRQLWRTVRRSVKPLRSALPAKRLEPDDPEPRRTATKPPLTPPSIVVTKPPPTAPALIGLDEKSRRRLSRGLVALDARIDLHGMGQDRAFSTLLTFLRQNQARGARLVLVITGKGRDGEGRGVLRQAVPGWLARPDLRALVIGFEEAGRRHGGAGALYVRLRRRGGERTRGEP